MSNDEHLKYPVGRFVPAENYSSEEIRKCIETIESLPDKLESVIKNITDKELSTPYRDGGWTVRQVIHHMADSHMNAFIRLKWTLTEETPTIKAYDEKAWAVTDETALDPVISINFLKALHIKWVALLKLLKAEELKKSFLHPETGKHVSLERQIATYAWHCDHHLAHIKLVVK